MPTVKDAAHTCFFCSARIAGERAQGWDQVWQSPVCGLCLFRVRVEQEEYYSPRGESLYEHVRGGDWHVPNPFVYGKKSDE